MTGFVRCGDLWVRADTITVIEVDYAPEKGGPGHYVVKVRSTALGAAAPAALLASLHTRERTTHLATRPGKPISVLGE